MLRLRKKKARSGLPPEVHDPFSAVPIIAPDVETHCDGRQLMQVRKKLKQKRGFFGDLTARLGFDRDTKASLDEKGSYFWRQIDGEKDLSRIERKFSGFFRIDRRESRRAIVQFTKTLMERGLIVLKVPGKPSPPKYSSS